MRNDFSNWEPEAGSPVITTDTITSNLSTDGEDVAVSSYLVQGNFEAQVDFEVLNNYPDPPPDGGPPYSLWTMYFGFEFKDDNNSLKFERVFMGAGIIGHAIPAPIDWLHYGLEKNVYMGGWGNDEGQPWTLSNKNGSMRVVRSGGMVNSYYREGTGAWQSLAGWRWLGTQDLRIHLQNSRGNPSSPDLNVPAEVRFSNFSLTQPSPSPSISPSSSKSPSPSVSPSASGSPTLSNSPPPAGFDPPTPYPDPNYPTRFWCGPLYWGPWAWPEYDGDLSGDHAWVYCNYQIDLSGDPATGGYWDSWPVPYAGIPSSFDFSDLENSYIEVGPDPPDTTPGFFTGSHIWDNMGYTWTVVLPWDHDERLRYLYPDPPLQSTKIYYSKEDFLWQDPNARWYPEVAGAGSVPFTVSSSDPDVVWNDGWFSKGANTYGSDYVAYSRVTEVGEDSYGTWFKIRPVLGTDTYSDGHDWPQVRVCGSQFLDIGRAHGGGWDRWVVVIPWGIGTSASFSPSASVSPSTQGVSPSASISPSISPSASVSPSIFVPTPSIPPWGPFESRSISPSRSKSQSVSPSDSRSPSPSVSPSASVSPSHSVSPSRSVSPSISPSASPSPSPGSPSASVSPSISPSASVSPSYSPSASESASKSPSHSKSLSISPSASISPSPSPTGEVFLNTLFHFYAVSGGTGQALDSLDGESVVDGDRAFVMENGEFAVYYLDAYSGEPESLPMIVAPDTHAGNKRWIRCT